MRTPPGLPSTVAKRQRVGEGQKRRPIKRIKRINSTFSRLSDPSHHQPPPSLLGGGLPRLGGGLCPLLGGGLLDLLLGPANESSLLPHPLSLGLLIGSPQLPPGPDPHLGPMPPPLRAPTAFAPVWRGTPNELDRSNPPPPEPGFELYTRPGGIPPGPIPCAGPVRMAMSMKSPTTKLLPGEHRERNNTGRELERWGNLPNVIEGSHQASFDF
jgi:hypothetical protein